MVNTDRPIITYSINLNNKRNEKSFLSINECSNAFESIKFHKLKNPKNILIDYLNVNSLKNKIIAVEELMSDKVDICLFSETKIDETFPNQQFKIQFDDIILIGDFDPTVENKNLQVFMGTFDMESLIKKPTCFQSATPNCIDLILANKKELFKNSNVLEVGISDHIFIATALKSQLIKENAKKLYRGYSTFQMEMLR